MTWTLSPRRSTAPMTRESVLDFETILAPITAANPCGIDENSVGSVVTQINLRSDLLKSNPSNLSATAREEIAGLVDTAKTILHEQCKSVSICVRLPCLLAILHGLEGFADGLDLISRLIDQYPAQYFPPEKLKRTRIVENFFDGDDDNTAVTYLPFLFCPVTAPVDEAPLSYAALRNSRLKTPDSSKEAEYFHSASKTPAEFYVGFFATLDGIISSSEALNKTFRAQLGGEGTQFTRCVSTGLMASIQRMREIVYDVASKHCPGFPVVPADANGSGGASAQAAGSVGNAFPTGRPASRQQAIEMLQRVADYFFETERHSPVSYRLKETIAWTKLELPDLLKKLLDDDDSRYKALGKLIGFETKEEPTQ